MGQPKYSGLKSKIITQKNSHFGCRELKAIFPLQYKKPGHLYMALEKEPTEFIFEELSLQYRPMLDLVSVIQFEARPGHLGI